jgi:hypothetical protein
MSSAPETFSLDHLSQHQQQQPPPLAEQEQLCYVHCNFCDTILAVRTCALVPSPGAVDLSGRNS